MTTGGRGVGSDEACSVKVLVDENGTVSGGVYAQISVTASVDASGYEHVSRLDPTLFLGRAFGVLFRSPAYGCRFGSGPGRFWVGVCRPWSHSFRRPLQQQKDQHLEEVAGQLFLEGKKQRVVNIVTVAWLVTAGLRGGQILEASSSTCSASHSLLPSASAAPPPQGFKTV